MAVDEKRVPLKDEERARIRWSSTKRGYVGLAEFYRGPRGARYRPIRSAAHVNRDRAVEETEAFRFRFRQPVSRLVLREVDHMGRILGEEEL